MAIAFVDLDCSCWPDLVALQENEYITGTLLFLPGFLYLLGFFFTNTRHRLEVFRAVRENVERVRAKVFDKQLRSLFSYTPDDAATEVI